MADSWCWTDDQSIYGFSSREVSDGQISYRPVGFHQNKHHNRARWKLYDLFWPSLRNHTVSLLDSVGCKWVTKASLVSGERDIDSHEWEKCIKDFVDMFKSTTLALRPSIWAVWGKISHFCFSLYVIGILVKIR